MSNYYQGFPQKYWKKKENSNIVFETKMDILNNVPTYSNKYYFVTATLKPQYYKYKPYKQLKKSLGELGEVINDDDVVASYQIVYELTQQNNIHYHMMLTCCADVALLTAKFQQLKYIGYIKVQELKSLKDIDKTLHYMLKQWKETQEMIFTAQLYKNPITQVYRIMGHMMAISTYCKTKKKKKKSKKTSSKKSSKLKVRAVSE